MGKREYSDYQRKAIDRYYENLDAIKLQTLQELVTEVFLAETPTKRDRLWERVAKAMAALEIPERIRQHILERRDPKLLAQHVLDWVKVADRRKK